MKIRLLVLSVFALVLAGASAANADVSFQIGTKDFYLSAGDYDYLPYVYQNDARYSPPRIDFHRMMAQYGRWGRLAPFGNVWRPYASSGWRPYTYGHWLYTEYGPYWEGYEPWAWAAYHYGSWVYDISLGWVWVPDYQWHPGRVAWARGYLTIGWMPLPPDGYDYERGRCERIGAYNQFTYSDSDFGVDFGLDSYSYGGPYYDQRARDMYYNQYYMGLIGNLWVFIDDANFDQDDYANCELGPAYVRYAFDEKMVRISNRPMEIAMMRTVIRQPIEEVPVAVRELRTNKGNIRVVVPSGSAPLERIREHSPETMKQVIAPAFATQKQQFKGRSSKIQPPIMRAFHQESAPPRFETSSRQQVINSAAEFQKNREQKRSQNMEAAKRRMDELKSKGRMMQPGGGMGRGK